MGKEGEHTRQSTCKDGGFKETFMVNELGKFVERAIPGVHTS